MMTYTQQKPGSLVRAHQIAGIRELADWLESHPDIPIPYDLSGRSEYSNVLIHASGSEDQSAVIAAVARALPGQVTKDVYDNDRMFDITGRLPGGIYVKAIAERVEVCERVVTGTREVTRTIPDPMVTIPTIEVTETVEDVEWRCGSILASKP